MNGRVAEHGACLYPGLEWRLELEISLGNTAPAGGRTG
jgi:hypothetical protein